MLRRPAQTCVPSAGGCIRDCEIRYHAGLWFERSPHFRPESCTVGRRAEGMRTGWGGGDREMWHRTGLVFECSLHAGGQAARSVPVQGEFERFGVAEIARCCIIPDCCASVVCISGGQVARAATVPGLGWRRSRDLALHRVVFRPRSAFPAFPAGELLGRSLCQGNSNGLARRRSRDLAILRFGFPGGESYIYQVKRSAIFEQVGARPFARLARL